MDGLAASILSTINKRIGIFLSKIKEIMNLSENPHMMGMRYIRCASTLYESEIVTFILNNSESWIGVTEEIIQKLPKQVYVELRELRQE